jgi:hypothetical protein
VFRYAAGFAVVSLIAFALVMGFAQAGNVEFKEYKIEAPGWISSHAVHDFNGDNRTDLILVSGREIRFWVQKSDGGFDSGYTQKFAFDNEAIFYDTGDVDGDNRLEIVVLHPGGVSAFSLENENYFNPVAKNILTAESLLRIPAEDEVARKPFFQDLTGDGEPDILLPQPNRYAIYSRGEAGLFKLACEVRVAMSASIRVNPKDPRREIRAEYWFPTPVCGDFDGDNCSDLLLQEGEFLAVFPGRAGGVYAVEPARLVKLDFLKDSPERQRMQRGFKLDFTLPMTATDINNDRIVDLVWTEVATGTIRIFLGARGGVSYEKPTMLIRVDGYAFHVRFLDVDGDGRRDLNVLATDKFGVWDAIKMLITKNVPVKALVYLNKGESMFGVFPDFVQATTVPLLVRQVKGSVKIGSPVVADYSGDFNSDARVDLLLRTGDEDLSIYFGRPDSVLAETPGQTIRIPVTSDHKFVMPVVSDFNGDGVSDIFLHYWSWDGKADRVYFFLSQS